MSHIILGKAGNKNVALDLDILLRTRGLIQGNSGSGKSWLVRRIAEKLFGKVQVIILDPEGEFSTLREMFGYVLVGKGGETPADLRSAAVVAQKMLELRASVVCDLYEMKASERHRWVRLFLEALINAPKKLWHPTVIIVDEAHQFCPEKGAGESEAADAMIALATRGRKRGFAAIFATQRLGKLRKDAAAELLNILIGQTFIDIDRKRAAEALGVAHSDQKKFFDEVKLLEPGHFYALGRAVSLDRILIHVGPVATTHPEPGSAKHAAEAPPPPEKVKALLPKLKDLPQAAEEKARTEAELRHEIRSLKGQLRAVPPTSPAKTQKIVERVVDPRGIERAVAQVERLRKAEVNFHGATIRTMFEAIRRLYKSVETLQIPEYRPAKIDLPKSISSHIHEFVKSPIPRLTNGPDRAPSRQPGGMRDSTPAARSKEIRTDNDGELTAPQRRVLQALAEFEAIGIAEISRATIASWCGIKHTTGSFGNYLSSLRVRGLIEDPTKETVRLTDVGRELVPHVETPVNTEEMFRRSEQALAAPEAKILRVLREVYPEAISREELGTRLGVSHTTGSFGNYLSKLRVLKMLTDGADKSVRCADWMFID